MFLDPESRTKKHTKPVDSEHVKDIFPGSKITAKTVKRTKERNTVQSQNQSHIFPDTKPANP